MPLSQESVHKLVSALGASAGNEVITAVNDSLSALAGAGLAGDSVVVTQGTLTADAQGYSHTATWNAGGVTFTAMKLNVTNTDSAANSLLFDLQVGGSSKFSVDKDGDVIVGGTLTVQGATTAVVNQTTTGTVGITVQSATAFAVARTGTNYAFQVDTNTASSATGLKVTAAAAAGGVALAAISSGTDESFTIDAKGAGVLTLGSVSTGGVGIGGSDVLLRRDAANALAVRNGANAQTMNIYGTFTDGSNYERLAVVSTAGSLFTIVAQTAGTGGDNLGITLQTAGTGELNLKIAGTQYLTLGGGASSGIWNIQLNTPNLTPGTTNSYDLGSTSLLVRSGYFGTSLVLGSGCTLVQGGTAAGTATSATRLVLKKTGIADNTATDVITVTVPNANHAACIKLRILSSNGSTDAFESSRCAEGMVVLARTTGADTVAAVAALELAQIATVASGATHTLAYGVSAMTGAAGATQTFTIQLTINDSGNVGSNQAVILAEVLNAEATGVTIAAA